MSVYQPQRALRLLLVEGTATKPPRCLGLGLYLWAGVFCERFGSVVFFFITFHFHPRTRLLCCTIVGSCMLCAHKLKRSPVATSRHKIVFSSSHPYPTRSVAVMS